MLTKSLRVAVFLIMIFTFFISTLSIEAKEEGSAIANLLLNTFFLPIHLLTPEGPVEPQITEEQKALYNMEDIPINLERDITLLIGKENGRVEFFWSQKGEEWIKADGEILEYLRDRYENRGKLIKEAEEYRTLKGMRKRLTEMHDSRLGVKGETKPVQ